LRSGKRLERLALAVLPDCLSVPSGLPDFSHAVDTAADGLLERLPPRLLLLGDLQLGLQEGDPPIDMGTAKQTESTRTMRHRKSRASGQQAETDNGNLRDALHRNHSFHVGIPNRMRYCPSATLRRSAPPIAAKRLRGGEAAHGAQRHYS